MIKIGEHWIAELGYNVKLDDGRCITIRWDLVEEEAP
jgi:hypothetical protein